MNLVTVGNLSVFLFLQFVFTTTPHSHNCLVWTIQRSSFHFPTQVPLQIPCSIKSFLSFENASKESSGEQKKDTDEFLHPWKTLHWPNLPQRVAGRHFSAPHYGMVSSLHCGMHWVFARFLRSLPEVLQRLTARIGHAADMIRDQTRSSALLPMPCRTHQNKWSNIEIAKL